MCNPTLSILAIFASNAVTVRIAVIGLQGLDSKCGRLSSHRPRGGCFFNAGITPAIICDPICVKTIIFVHAFAALASQFWLGHRPRRVGYLAACYWNAKVNTVITTTFSPPAFFIAWVPAVLCLGISSAIGNQGQTQAKGRNSHQSWSKRIFDNRKKSDLNSMASGIVSGNFLKHKE